MYVPLTEESSWVWLYLFWNNTLGHLINWVVLYLNFKVKFKYSKKATKFSEISTADLSYVVTVKSTVEIAQKFVAFSEYMNFTIWRGWTFSSRGWPRGYAWGRCVICISHNLQRRSWWRGQNRICRGCWGRNGSRGRGLIGGCGWGWKREKFDWKVHASMLDLVLFQEDSENFI